MAESKTKHLVYKKTTYSKYGKREKTGHGFLDTEKNILFLGSGRYKYVDGKRKEIYVPISNPSKYFSPIAGKSDQYKGIYYNPVEFQSKDKTVVLKRRKNNVKLDSSDIVVRDKFGKKYVYSSKPVSTVKYSQEFYGNASSDMKFVYDEERQIVVPFRRKKPNEPKSKNDIAFRDKSGAIKLYTPTSISSGRDKNKLNDRFIADLSGTVVYQNQYIWYKFKK